MTVWQFLSEKLAANHRAVLLYVIDNEGSSPGRKGFAMALTDDGQFTGTIGGGIMEVKLLELAKSMLREEKPTTTIKKQYHDKQHAHDRSGMICSGEQTVALVPLSGKAVREIQKIVQGLREGTPVHLEIDEGGLSVSTQAELSEVENNNNTTKQLPATTEKPFPLVIRLPIKKRLHIFGGGHVGLALSEVLSLLDYHIIIYDDRPGLNTLSANHYAHEIRIVDYGEVAAIDDLLPQDRVILVTTSYRTDKLLLRQLYNKPFAYLGMMGSEAKVKTLLEELDREGIPAKELSHLHAPIGLNIFSKTAREIAVSVAAELIFFANRDLPTGRS